MNCRAPFLSLCCLVLAGCAAPRVEVPRAASILGTRVAEQRIPIRAFSVESSDRPYEIKSDIRFISGDSRGVLFPKQAREFISQDLRDYVESRFAVDERADTVLTLKLEQAHSYFTMHHNGLNWVPFVGVVTSIADGFQQNPITFIVEVKASVRGAPIEVSEVNTFIRRTEQITGWSGTIEKHREIYRGQIDQVRKELFDRMDAQLITLWRDGHLIAQGNQSSLNNAATLASELARLDTALADEKLTKEEYAKMITAVKAKYSTSLAPAGTGVDNVAPVPKS